jgi:hypothetical protein
MWWQWWLIVDDVVEWLMWWRNMVIWRRLWRWVGVEVLLSLA